MSAIFGFYNLDGRPAAESHLRVMAERIAFRGPDGGAIWSRGAVGMGHRLLATSSGERVPLVDQGTLVITAEARIDNRRELAVALNLEHHGDDIGDADLILAAYQRWGEQAPEHLVGDFAFAIWDARTQTIFCARDQMGVRPFYYHHCPERLFTFASEIKAVLACPGVPRRLNADRVARHLLRDFDDTRSTFYQGISRLPAAHVLVVGRRSIQMRRYWSLDCERELRLGSDEEYAEAFREIFIEAVRCRTRRVVSVGSTLSGGLDSSSIACTANLVLTEGQRPLRTFSAVFPSLSEPELRRIDERSYVETVLKGAQFDPTYVYADQSSPLHDWPQMLQNLDEACLAPNLYLHWGLYKAAAAKGVRVLLDGIDGDTTVSHGIGHLTDLVRAGRWLRFLREADAVCRRNPSAFHLRSVVWQCGIRPLVPEQVVRTWQAVRRRSAGDQDNAVIDRSLTQRVRPDEAARPPPHSDSARETHCRALRSPLVPYVMDFADATSSAFGVEVRYPFFDRRLIEFCLSIPADQKLRRGWTRWIMRRAMAGILPPEIQWRVNKADLSPNFTRRLYECDRAIIEETVGARLACLDGYVDAAAVRKVYQRWLEHPRERQAEALTLFSVVTLALWIQGSGHGSVAEPGT